MMPEEQTAEVEHFVPDSGDRLGWVIRWKVQDYSVAFWVFEVVKEQPLWFSAALDGRSITEDLAEAQPMLRGSIRWDGCGDLELMPEENDVLHLCGYKAVERFAKLLDHLWDRAADLLGATRDDFFFRS